MNIHWESLTHDQKNAVVAKVALGQTSDIPNFFNEGDAYQSLHDVCPPLDWNQPLDTAFECKVRGRDGQIYSGWGKDHVEAYLLGVLHGCGVRSSGTPDDREELLKGTWFDKSISAFISGPLRWVDYSGTYKRQLLDALDEQLQTMLNRGFRKFFMGTNQGFDLTYGEHLMQQYDLWMTYMPTPNFEIILVDAYESIHQRPLASRATREMWERLTKMANRHIQLPGNPSVTDLNGQAVMGHIDRRNAVNRQKQWFIDNTSGLLIARDQTKEQEKLVRLCKTRHTILEIPAPN